MKKYSGQLSIFLKSPPYALLDLLMNALIFVIKPIVLALAGHAGYKACHFVLIEREGAGVGVGIVVILIKFAALTACGVLFTVF